METLDGALLLATRERRAVAMALSTDGGCPVPSPPFAMDVAPSYHADGLVEVRPAGVAYDDPLYGSYDWVAMLDPVELAEGVAFDEPREVDHRGRLAWETLAWPGPGYEPRCSCCPLLFCAQSEALEAEGGGRQADPDLAHAETQWSPAEWCAAGPVTGVA